tara:strand:+ start:794 stop:1843 length:1050 start_codon:yes stop_codon:yes gene_type:complete
MKLLITGGCGFIGSNFILNQLRSTSNTIFNVDKLTYSGNLTNLKSLDKNKNYQFIQGDIIDSKLIKDIIFDYKPNRLIHFAAESHVDRSIDSPMPFIQTNIVGTANLLDISYNYWLKNRNSDFRFIHISTDEVYGSLGKTGFFDEKTPYNPKSPYSSSKASSDHLVRAWHSTYNLPVNITNCSNNYGPFQFPEKLVPLMIINSIDEKPLPIYGKGDNVRDWLFVNDHCTAINQVMHNGRIGETYNIGGINELSNLEIVNQICKALDKKKPRRNDMKYSELITFVDDRPGHDFRYAINPNKIQNELGWSPKESYKTGLNKTIDWYLKNESWWREIQSKKYHQERLGLKKS